MRRLVRAKEMKEIDRRTIEYYKIPSMVLMERAALAVATEARRILEENGLPAGHGGMRRTERRARAAEPALVWAVCGPGNNGADGIAAARILYLWGYRTVVITAGEHGSLGHISEEFQAQLEIAQRLGISVCDAGAFMGAEAAARTEPCSLVIDAVFGIGLSREVNGAYKTLIDLICAQRQAFVVSVDIPSGISSDTGKSMGCHVRADSTVTFGEMKLGQALFPGRTACGKLLVADIGFAPKAENPLLADIGAGAAFKADRISFGCVMSCEPSDLLAVPFRRADANKGSFKKVLVIAGAVNMAGAAYFSALAAYRCGAGMVKIFTAEENRVILQSRLPQAILSVFDRKEAEERPEEFRKRLRQEMDWAGVIVIGPGLGKDDEAKIMVESVLRESSVPVVMDADAINLAALHPQFKVLFSERLTITPHVLEMARLTGTDVSEIKDSPIEAASAFSAETGAVCVLKDAATVTTAGDGSVFVNRSGSPALAKGGSGDVLSGVIAGLLSIGMDMRSAAVLGVYIHGLAGERAAKECGAHSVLCEDILNHIGEVLHVSV